MLRKSFSRNVIVAISALLIALFTPNLLIAQLDTGGVTGTVKDPTGAVMAGAKITLTNSATGVAASTVSTSTGTYVFDGVRPGTYTIQGEAAGFQAYVAKGIEVHVQKTVTLDIPLAAGNVAQQVTVTAAAPLLQAAARALPEAPDRAIARPCLNLPRSARARHMAGGPCARTPRRG